MEGREGEFYLRNGEKIEGSISILSKDSISMSTDYGYQKECGINAVTHFTTVDRLKGLRDLLIATLIFGSIGFLLVYSTYSDEDVEKGFFDYTRVEWAAIYAGIFAAPVVLFGLPIAATSGHKTELGFGNEVQIEISSIIEESDQLLIITRNGKIFRLFRSQVTQIKRSDDKIYITIPRKLYDNKFKYYIVTLEAIYTLQIYISKIPSNHVHMKGVFYLSR